MNSAFPSRKMRDCELAHSFCFWKTYKHTRKMAKVLSFKTIPHFYWKNDKGVQPANGIQPAFCGDFIKGMLDFLSEDKTMDCCTILLLERAEQDGETIRRAAHRSRAQAWKSS